MNERRAQIHTEHKPPKTRRCELLTMARSSAYYVPEPVSEEDLVLMRLIDEIHLRLPFYGSRRMRDELQEHGRYCQSQAYPTPDAVDGLEGAVSAPANEPTRQGAQDISVPAQGPLYRACGPGLGDRHLLFADGQGVHVSGGHHGLAVAQGPDNVFVECLWRSVKYEDVYLHAYETPAELRAGLTRYFEFYNTRRRHSALHRRTPDAVYFEQATPQLAARNPWKILLNRPSKFRGPFLPTVPIMGSR